MKFGHKSANSALAQCEQAHTAVNKALQHTAAAAVAATSYS
jgi:hypothetical protein